MSTGLGNTVRRYKNSPVFRNIVKLKVENLSDYFAIISDSLDSETRYWFRGHATADWGLVPSALRFVDGESRRSALNLISEFQRVVDFRIPNSPREDERLKWMQIAQHYGLPTRLLDWTESATTALFFACLNFDKNGIVYVINPVDINRMIDPRRPRIFDTNTDFDLINKYVSGGHLPKTKTALNIIAINPVLNDERLIVQRGVFTLHGDKNFALTEAASPSVIGIPILKEYKEKMSKELERIGVDELSLFPDLEHASKYLKRNLSGN